MDIYGNLCLKCTQPGTAYSTSGLFRKNKARIKKFKETGY